MTQLTEIKVPDIGDFHGVAIIELFVKPGDTLAVDDSICTLESDKATLDIPSPAASPFLPERLPVGRGPGRGFRPLPRRSLRRFPAPDAGRISRGVP